MIPQLLIQQLQVEFLKRIALLIERGKIDLKTAKEWGKELLTLLPFTSLEDMKQKIQNFAKKYSLLENLPLVISHFEDNKRTNNTVSQMERLLKNNKAEESLHLTT